MSPITSIRSMPLAAPTCAASPGRILPTPSGRCAPPPLGLRRAVVAAAIPAWRAQIERLMRRTNPDYSAVI